MNLQKGSKQIRWFILVKQGKIIFREKKNFKVPKLLTQLGTTKQTKE